MTLRILRTLPLLLLAFCLPASAAPTLTFQKILGDLRGKELPGHCLSVTIDDAGTCYALSDSGRVRLFDKAGKYVRTQRIPLEWPFTYRYLCAVGTRVFSGVANEDYPWVFSPQRVGAEPGRFTQPAMVALDPATQQVYVADTGNSRVQRFALDQTDTPSLVLPLPAKPFALAARGGTLAVLAADQTLSILDATANPPTPLASRKLPQNGTRVALGPDQTVVVVYGWGAIAKFSYAGGTLTDAGILATSPMDDWPRLLPATVPLSVAPDGQIWWVNDLYGKFTSLDPATDTFTDRGPAPYRSLCLAFGPGGLLYVGGFVPQGAPGPSLAVYQWPALTKLPPFPAAGTLYNEPGVPVWGMLPDEDGGMYTRVIEPGYQKGWPALAFKKIYPDGKTKPLADFGELYGKRTVFAPSEALYALKFDAAHNLLLASFQLQAVLKLTPEGKTLWEASAKPQGGADQVDFVQPRDLALDSAGNIWVVDGRADKVYCLSPEGKLLLTYGHPGGIDDVSGGFDTPTGVAVASVEGSDYLYVADAGNYRLMKFIIGKG